MQDVLEASLKHAADSIDGQLKKMNNYLQAENLRGFAIEAHGLKGALANIGATENCELAAELEIAAKADNMLLCMNKFVVLFDTVKNFANELRLIFPNAEPVNKPHGDSNLLANNVSKAIASLDNFETGDALEYLNELGKFTFGEETDALISDAKVTIDAFNYEKTILLLNEIENKMT